MPSVVQQFDQDARSSGVTTTTPFGSAFTAGNSVYILIQANDTSSTNSFTESANSYSLLAGPATIGGTRYWLYRATNVSGTQPSFTLTTNSAFAQWAGWEVSGDQASSPIDGSIAANTANDASPTSGSITVSNANDLVLASMWTPGFGRSATLGASFTHIEGTFGPWGSVGYKTESGTTFAETGTVSSAVSWIFIVIPLASTSTPPPSGGAIVQNLMIG
jgi:hypothetical protein